MNRLDKKLEFLLKLGSLDRRYIFLAIGIAVLVPLLKPVGLPIEPTPTTKAVYDAIDQLPPKSKILLSIEFGPSTKPELYPMAAALLRHFFRNDYLVYITCLWPDGEFMALEVLEEIAINEFNKTYGEDFVFLGFRPGNEAVVKGMVSNIRYMYTVDYKNTLIDNIPMMEDIRNLSDFSFLMSLSAGYPGSTEWLQYGSDPTGVPMSTGTTSIQVNELIPYVNSGQLKGIIAGMPGAAEYEKLIGTKGMGFSGMDAQSIAHVVIVLFIILGNITFFIERKKKNKKGVYNA